MGIKSVKAEVNGNILVIRSSKPLTSLSSAVVNGGLVETHGIINVQVPEGTGEDKNDAHWNAESFLKKQVQTSGLPQDTVGLMTAAKMRNISVAARKLEKTAIAVFVTAGTTVAVTAGEPAASKQPKLGTINIILIVDGNMTDGCMVETHKTITEAKTVALRELDIRSQFSGDLASGTLTDTVAVACTKRGDLISYAGTFTLIGEAIAKCVRQGVGEAILKQEGVAPDRQLLKRLAERGIQTGEVLNILEESKIKSGTPKYEELKKELHLALTDKRIESLILLGLRLDDDLKKGLLPRNGENILDQVAFEEIVLDSLRNFNSEKDQPATSRLRLQLRNEETLGPFTTGVFKAILKKTCSHSK